MHAAALPAGSHGQACFDNLSDWLHRLSAMQPVDAPSLNTTTATTATALLQVGMRVLGVVENMSGLQQAVSELRFLDGSSGQQQDVTEQVLQLLRGSFGQELALLSAHAQVFHASKGGAERMCADMGVALLGKVPMDPALGRAAEEGRSVFGEGAAAVAAPALRAVVAKIMAAVGEEGSSSDGVA